MWIRRIYQRRLGLKGLKRFLPEKSGFSRLGRGDILAPAILMVEEGFQAEVATADREL